MIDIRIQADNASHLHEQLRALLGLSGKESAVATIYPVDSPNTVGQDTPASPAEPAPAMAHKPKTRTPKANGSSVHVPQTEQDQTPEVPAGEAPTDIPVTTTETHDHNPEAEIGSIVQRITALCINDKSARDRVTEWRDQRGMKWLRELSVEHLDDARDLLKELSP